MYTISFDQASSDTGYSVFKGDELLDYGKFKAKSSDFFDRVVETRDFIDSVIGAYDLDQVATIALEDIQFQGFRGGNVVTFKRLAQLQGILILHIQEKYSVDVELANASQWKSYNGVKGRGRTEQKRNAQKLVGDLYGLSVTQDEADAILLGRFFANQSMNWGGL